MELRGTWFCERVVGWKRRLLLSRGELLLFIVIHSFGLRFHLSFLAGVGVFLHSGGQEVGERERNCLFSWNKHGFYIVAA